MEKYTTYGGSRTTLAAAGLPVNTVNGQAVYADIHTAVMLGAPAPPALRRPAVPELDRLVNARPMTEAEFDRLKRRVGVWTRGRNYNRIIGGHGTGLRPPTEEQWARIRTGTRIIDSLKPAGAAPGLPPSVDLSASKHFPPIGDQGVEGSCTSWSNAYYIKTFQEALEHDWDLSGVRMVGAYPGYPDSMQDRIFSPDFVYHQVNGGMDGGSFFTGNAEILCGIGAASWLSFPNNDRNTTSWPSEAAWREAPLFRGSIPDAAAWGTTYCLNVDTDQKVNILKTLLANNIPISIAVDANQYRNLTADDVWDAANYRNPAINHVNTIVGYCD